MSEEIKNENVCNVEEATTLTDDQVHHIYDELSDVDKESGETLAAAEKETNECGYTTEDNTVIESEGAIPGINMGESDVIVDTIKETEDDIKSALSPYNLDTDSTIKMINVINDYKAGNRANLYARLPESFKALVDNLIASEIKGASFKQVLSMKNAGAKIVIDSFINDAKVSAAVDDFSSEMNAAVSEMNSEYDDMVGKAIEDTFSKIEEIRAKDPEQAKRIELIKEAFDDAITFNRQLEYAQNTPSYWFSNSINNYNKYINKFNTKVNNNTFGVKVPKIEEIVPIIKAAIPDKYSGNDIRKFIVCIYKTIKDPKELAGTAYNYRMISSIYRYKFTAIDEKGKILFENISKVIDAIKS